VTVEPNALTADSIDIVRDTLEFLGAPVTVGSGDMVIFTTSGTAPGGLTPGNS
jgi:hypothetical protein